MRAAWRRRWKSLMKQQRYVLRALRRKPVAHFLHVGKTGGTALRYTLQPFLDSGRYTLFLHGHAMTLPMVKRGEKVFFFQRDPLSKFLSGFYYRRRQARPHYDIPWRPQEAVAFANFASANELARSLSAADPRRREQAVHAMRSIHQVKDSPFRWLDSEEYFRSRLDDILFIGFQEQLDSDFGILRNLLAVPDWVRTPPADATVYQKNREAVEPLDSTAIENLRAWYARDLEFYELCRQLRAERSLTP